MTDYCSRFMLILGIASMNARSAIVFRCSNQRKKRWLGENQRVHISKVPSTLSLPLDSLPPLPYSEDRISHMFLWIQRAAN